MAPDFRSGGRFEESDTPLARGLELTAKFAGISPVPLSWTVENLQGPIKGHAVKTFGRALAVWVVALLLCFLAANLTGLIRNMGLLPFRYTSFPFTFAVWGRTVEEFFDWNLLYLNALIAIGVSLLAAAFLAWHRSRSLKTSEQNSKETNNTQQEIP